MLPAVSELASSHTARTLPVPLPATSAPPTRLACSPKMPSSGR